MPSSIQERTLLPYHSEDSARALERWQSLAALQTDPLLAAWLLQSSTPGAPFYAILTGVFGTSPYLSRLLLTYPHIAHSMATSGADTVWDTLIQSLRQIESSVDTAALMGHLRLIKNQAALLIALADTSGAWALEQVTKALSLLAEYSLEASIRHILTHAHLRKDIVLPNPQQPEEGSGIIVLGMGKLGGYELNYSSDIDLILLYEPGRLQYSGRISEQKFMNQLSHELVKLMQERTPQGYVFRTDLRLRPDPASTPPMVNTEAAYYYYESVGQNWERAAMIKARCVAGDREAGARFLKNIVPFMWRRHLDFATIADIHSIKRQMDSRHHAQIQVAGHNVKLGMGGIREIEFYVQIHQLIWGGREPSLRLRATCDALRVLAECGLITSQSHTLMRESYVFLRTLEHRLQMVDDAQTHTMPTDDAGIARIACFMGYENRETFESRLLEILVRVHTLFSSSFKSEGNGELGEAGNLVFTGVSHDPNTLETLRGMGYTHPETVSEIVMGWHHGSCRATRTKRARELLTELMPTLLKRLSETAQPDTAFLKFHEFLSNLPAGVQLFSLFQVNPQLLGLIADIMGSAPLLASWLSRTPELLDAVLYEDFYTALPSRAQLQQQLESYLDDFSDVELSLERLCRFRNEKQFQAGVQLLKNMISARDIGFFLTELAEVVLDRCFVIVEREFVRHYGRIQGCHFAVIALGKLGSREMTFTSDLDLVFVYEAEDFERVSDGEKSYSPSVYFNRLAQRVVNALTAVSRAGRLYEVDTRLRPSGKQGLLAVSTKALDHYFSELAWTFEFMALTKARPVIADVALRQTLTRFIEKRLMQPRDDEKLRQDVIDMRRRIHKEHGTQNPWNIKYVAGGMLDCDFLAQYLFLHQAPRLSSLPESGSADAIFRWLLREGAIEHELADQLINCFGVLEFIFHRLRLTFEQSKDQDFDEANAPEGLKKILSSSVDAADFTQLKHRLIQVEQLVRGHYNVFLDTTASNLHQTKE